MYLTRASPCVSSRQRNTYTEPTLCVLDWQFTPDPALLQILCVLYDCTCDHVWSDQWFLFKQSLLCFILTYNKTKNWCESSLLPCVHKQNTNFKILLWHIAATFIQRIYFLALKNNTWVTAAVKSSFTQHPDCRKAACCFAVSSARFGVHVLRFLSELPGVPHHENKVDVAVDGGTDSTVIVDELLFGHLSMRGKMSPLLVLHHHGSQEFHYDVRSRADYEIIKG